MRKAVSSCQLPVASNSRLAAKPVFFPLLLWKLETGNWKLKGLAAERAS
jgi:hypothetical protein